MSHIVDMKMRFKDLDTLKRACNLMGLEFKEDKKTYKWYGTSVGGQIPEGFTKADLGKCEHAIGIKGNDKAYELGVVSARDGKGGYILHADFWNGGYGLEKVVGPDCGLLKQAYTSEISAKSLRRQGYRVSTSVNSEGEIVLQARG